MLEKVDNPRILTTLYHYSAAWDWRASETDPLYDGPRPDGFERFSKKRRLEFLAGRFCAAKAIGLMGAGADARIGVNSDRSPHWPKDLIGSITHTEGFVSAAVAEERALQGLGIDSEKIQTGEPLEAIRKIASTDEERALIAEAGLGEAEAHFLLFSAKESIYKCVSPIVGAFFDFSAAIIYKIDPSAGTFRSRLTKDLGDGFAAGLTLCGRFEFKGAYVHTALELPK